MLSVASFRQLHQIPGITFTKGINESLNRLKKEIFGESKEILKLEQLEFAGAEIHFEQERNANCFTLVWYFEISKESIINLSGKWKFFPKNKINDQKIIDHHRETLGWVNDKKRSQFVDLR